MKRKNQQVEQYQILVYNKEGDIVSSQHYDNDPSDSELMELLGDNQEIHCYLLIGNHEGKLLYTFGE